MRYLVQPLKKYLPIYFLATGLITSANFAAEQNKYFDLPSITASSTKQNLQEISTYAEGKYRVCLYLEESMKKSMKEEQVERDRLIRSKLEDNSFYQELSDKAYEASKKLDELTQEISILEQKVSAAKKYVRGEFSMILGVHLLPHQALDGGPFMGVFRGRELLDIKVLTNIPTTSDQDKEKGITGYYVGPYSRLEDVSLESYAIAREAYFETDKFKTRVHQESKVKLDTLRAERNSFDQMIAKITADKKALEEMSARLVVGYGSQESGNSEKLANIIKLKEGFRAVTNALKTSPHIATSLAKLNEIIKQISDKELLQSIAQDNEHTDYRSVL